VVTAPGSRDHPDALPAAPEPPDDGHRSGPVGSPVGRPAPVRRGRGHRSAPPHPRPDASAHDHRARRRGAGIRP